MIRIYKILLSVLLVMSGLYCSASKAKKAKTENRKERFKLQLQGVKTGNKKSKFKKLYDKKLKRVRYFDDKVIVKFKTNTKKSVVKRYMLKNNLEPILKLGKRTYSCQVRDSVDHPEEILKILVSEGMSQEAFPGHQTEEDAALVEIDIDEYREVLTNGKRSRRRNRLKQAQLHRSQWHLRNSGQAGSVEGADINVDDAWKFSKGLGVKVAVIDTGFDLKHLDINYYSEGYDISTDKVGAKAPSRSRENHGTAVAGIIAALDNDKGVVGVAPKSQIIPIRLLTDDGMVSISQIIAAHRKAVELGADIINDSWGSYDPTLAKGQSLNLTSLEKALYQELEEEANDGRGVVVIFASGNSGKSNFNNAPEARNPYTLSVGATNSKDQRASYSLYGAELDLVAPGGDDNAGIVTTDRKDLKIRKNGKKKRQVLGYSKGNFATSFTGTSAAAPVVSGVAALVWSINPNLTARQVKEILRLSARKDLNKKYKFTSEKNSELGYGIVDAGAAVRLAMQY